MPRAKARLQITVPIAEAIVGGALGWPSKMPCPAWGISAERCRRGSRLAEKPGTVCASCYARRGHYLGPSVERAHARRLEATSHPLWAEAMAVLVDAFARGAYFRWFDSGDLQSLEHLDKIIWVARRTPSVAHWLPTHEPYLVRERRDALPSNLVLRISSDRIAALPTVPTWNLPTSTVHRHPGEPVRAPAARRGDSIECLSHLRGHRCGTCRACWSPKVKNVSYLLNAGLRSPARETKKFHLTVVP